LTSPEQQRLVLLAQCNDRDAIEQLLRGVQPSLTRYVRALVGTRHAEDVTQEVLVTIYRKLWMLNRAELFRPWMFRVASRTAFHYLKKQQRWPDHLRDDDALDEVAARDLEELAREVDALLQDPHVTPASRAVLVLHFKEGMTLPEVAAVLDIPLGTAKSRLAYGLAALRRHHATGGNDD